MTIEEIRKLCGWVPYQDRTREQNEAHNAIVDAMPKFAIAGETRGVPDKTLLWEPWSDPMVLMSTGGIAFGGMQQETGSCVGAGGGTAIFTLAAVEVVRLKDPEQALIPFWPLPYGRSRYLGGMRGPGSGSFGSAFAKAMKEDGVIPSSTEGLPMFEDRGQIFYGKAVELKWSDGARIEQKWLDLSRKHLVKTVAQVKNHEEAIEALANGYPITFCGNWGGRMRPPVVEGVLLNERADTWNHQESCLGYMKHPTFGWLLWIHNQWGQKTHGKCPTGAPEGGFWIRGTDFDYQARQNECFAWSQFDGFPAQTLDWRKVA